MLVVSTLKVGNILYKMELKFLLVLCLTLKAGPFDGQEKREAGFCDRVCD